MNKAFKFFSLLIFFILPIDAVEQLAHQKLQKKNLSLADRQYSNQKFRDGLFQRFYVNHLDLQLTRKSQPTIPKIIHQIWIGSPLPERFEKMVASWKEHHPDWQYILWDDESLNSFTLVNQELFDSTSNYGAKADILRYEILQRFGGLYVDIDYECLKPFDELHDSFCEFYTCKLSKTQITNALIACIANHPVLNACVNNLKSTQLKRKTSAEILQQVGPFYFTRQVFDYLLQKVADESTIIFSESFSFPLPSQKKSAYWKQQMTEEELKTYKNTGSYAIHYWANSWMPNFKLN